MDYAFVHDGKAFTPNGSTVAVEDIEVHNTDLERAELAHWDTRPDRMLAYYDVKKGTVSTWRGRHLGVIDSSRIYTHNFGGRFISLRVRGSNGAQYYGRASYDWGSCVRLRRSKESV